MNGPTLIVLPLFRYCGLAECELNKIASAPWFGRMELLHGIIRSHFSSLPPLPHGREVRPDTARQHGTVEQITTHVSTAARLRLQLRFFNHYETRHCLERFGSILNTRAR